MRHARPKNLLNPCVPPAKKCRGVALITTMLLLTLMVAMTLAMTISVTSDTLITKYYRNARSSFYAADSGVNIVREYMLNYLSTNAGVAGATFATTGVPPLSATDGPSALSTALSTYGTATSTLINGGNGSGSWPGTFTVVASQSGTLGTSLGSPTCAPVFTSPNTGTGTVSPASGPYGCVSGSSNYPTCTGTCTGFAITDFDYSYPYTITVIGQSRANEQAVVEDAGSLVLDVHVQPSTSSTTSFAAFGTFIDQYAECSSPFAPGTLTGPFSTNGAWTYADTGSYTFTGKVSSNSSTFGYTFGNSCYSSSNATYKSGSNTIAPTYQAGYTLGAPLVPLPVNDFNQKEAVVDGLGNSWTANNLSSAQQDAQMNAHLLTVDGNYTPYPTAGTSNPGVYLAYTSTTTNGVTTNTMTGGGIYVEGSASSVMLSTSNPTVNGTAQSDQLFTVSQSGNTTTNVGNPVTSGNTTTQVTTTTVPTVVTTVTVDPTSNITTVSQTTTNAITATTTTTTTTSTTRNGHTTTHTSTSTSSSTSNSSSTTSTSINGVPENLSGSSSTPATMLYVDGTIGNSSNTGLSGPGQGLPAIQNGAAVTITAAGSIDVTGDILYKTEPVTTTQNQIPNTPADTLIPGNNNGQVLGLFTATGDIAEYNQQSNGNIEIDASLAMLSQGGTGGWINDGNAINTITVVGGRVANAAKVCNCTTRNIYFDQRFTQGGFAPPWFPSTTITGTSSDSVVSVSATTTRTQWLNAY